MRPRRHAETTGRILIGPRAKKIPGAAGYVWAAARLQLTLSNSGFVESDLDFEYFLIIAKPLLCRAIQVIGYFPVLQAFMVLDNDRHPL